MKGLHGDPPVPFALKLRFSKCLDCIILTNKALVKLVLPGRAGVEGWAQSR